MLFPSFIAGTMSSGKEIELRVEDFLLLFFGLAVFLYFLATGKFKIKKPPFFVPIIILLVIEFFGVLLNSILGNLFFIDRAFFYFFKEVELLFLYFYVFYNLESIKSAKVVIKFILLFTGLNIAYLFYQIISHKEVGEYVGNTTAALSEYGIFPTAAFFVMIFVFLTAFFIFYYNNLKDKLWQKLLFGAIVISSVIGVFGTGSKTSFLALVFSVIILFLLLLFKRNKEAGKIIILGIIIVILLMGVFVFSLKSINTVRGIVGIFGFSKLAESYTGDRLIYQQLFIKNTLYTFGQQPLSIFFGLGVGYITEAHNQFLRNFAEIGITGSIVFLVMIFFILRAGFRAYRKSEDPFIVAAGAGIIVMTLAMMVFSIATDPFFSVKVASMYWFFIGLNVAILSFKIKNKADFKNTKV